MDTPEKSKASISASEFQDSPLFNYMCNLSPIDPIKPRPCPLIFNSLNFASPPSVFASPNVSSLKESRFVRRHQFGTPLKSELASSGNGKKGEGVSAAKLSDMCPYELSGCSPGNSTGESAYDPPNEHLEFTAEFLRTLKDNSCSPDDNVNPSNANRTDAIPEKESNLASQVQLGEHDSIETRYSLQSEVQLRGICKLNHELTESRAGKLFLDDSDLLIFNSPTKGKHSEGKHHKIVDSGTMPFLSSVLQLSEEDPSDFPDGMHESPAVAPSISREQHEGEVLETPPKIIGKLFETDEVGTIISEKSQDRQVVSNSTADANDDGKMVHSSCKKHGRRRRCLLFEMTGAVEKKSTCYSDDSSSSSFHYNDRCDPNKKEFVTARNINRCSSLKASGIGLHLNAITNTSIDEKVGGHKTLAYGRHLIRTTCSTSSVTSVTCSQKHLVKSLAKTAMEGDLFNHDNQVMKDASPISKLGIVEELNHSSPKKKRRTSEYDSKGMACKQCNCKKSKCLKLYCDCFAAGLYCFDPCSCQDCYNKPLHEQTVRETRKQIEMRDPLAFTPKVIKTNFVPEFGKESNRTPASARHRRGCNCKKSNCLKKYCECLQGGVGCSIDCKCEDCQNIFNQKNETEETEEMEQDGNSVSILVDAVLQDADVQTGQLDEQSDNHQQASGIFAPHSRLSPPESTTSSEKCDLAKKTSKSGFKQSLTVKDPEILRDDFLLHSRVKSTTPNSKRVSPHSAGS